MYNLQARSDYFKKTINKIDFTFEVLLESDDYDFIKEKEKEFISLYGRKSEGGLLVNLTEGGDGNSEVLISQEHRELLSQLQSGGSNRMAKKVIRLADNKIFGSASEAYKSTKFSKEQFYSRVFGNEVNNDTGFITLEEFNNNDFSSLERGLKYINLHTKEKFKTLKDAFNNSDSDICYTWFLKRFNSENNTTCIVRIEDYFEGMEQNEYVNPQCRMIENAITGEVYASITECVKKLDLKYSTLALHLTGRTLNKKFTHLKYKN